jgi:hypothetical protein
MHKGNGGNLFALLSIAIPVHSIYEYRLSYPGPHSVSRSITDVPQIYELMCSPNRAVNWNIVSRGHHTTGCAVQGSHPPSILQLLYEAIALLAKAYDINCVSVCVSLPLP